MDLHELNQQLIIYRNYLIIGHYVNDFIANFLNLLQSKNKQEYIHEYKADATINQMNMIIKVLDRTIIATSKLKGQKHLDVKRNFNIVYHRLFKMLEIANIANINNIEQNEDELNSFITMMAITISTEYEKLDIALTYLIDFAQNEFYRS